MKNLIIALTTLLLSSSFINANVWKCPGVAKNYKTKAEAETVCGNKAFYSRTQMGHMRHGGVISRESKPVPGPTKNKGSVLLNERSFIRSIGSEI